MASPLANSPPLSAALSGALDEQTKELKTAIEECAKDLAARRTGKRGFVSVPDLSEASRTVMLDWLQEAGTRLPTRAERLFAVLSPFTLVCALLCAIFALLGWLALRGSIDPKLAGATAGFLDIAKIFAGAIVGSTSAVALKSKH